MTKPAYILALLPLIRELRARVADRVSDDALRRMAWDGGIRLTCRGQAWDALAVTVAIQNFETADGRLVRPSRQDETVLAMASDRTARAALRRLLDSAPDACCRAALTPTTTLPTIRL